VTGTPPRHQLVHLHQLRVPCHSLRWLPADVPHRIPAEPACVSDADDLGCSNKCTLPWQHWWRWLLFIVAAQKRCVKKWQAGGELARALLSFKRPTSPRRTATVPTIRSFHLGYYVICFFSQSSKPNEMSLKQCIITGSTPIVDRGFTFRTEELSSWKVPNFGRSAVARNADIDRHVDWQ